MENKRIDITNLSFSYGSQVILEDVNLFVNEKDFVTILGPNGGGKTTLLRLLLGLLKPQRGSILIDGKPPFMVQKRLGYVPQHSHFDKKFPITVFEVVLTGRSKPFGYYSKYDKMRTCDVLDKVGLSEYRNELFSNLSGGQVQRMLIARALVTDGEILLLDEPTSNIDSNTGKNLNTLLQKINEKLTILVVTHDTGFVSNITNRVFYVNRTVVEHPMDNRIDDIIASSYGNDSMIVRHDTELRR